MNVAKLISITTYIGDLWALDEEGILWRYSWDRDKAEYYWLPMSVRPRIPYVHS